MTCNFQSKKTTAADTRHGMTRLFQRRYVLDLLHNGLNMCKTALELSYP
jgi:hypothetical protein